MKIPADMVGRQNEWERLVEFASNDVKNASLGIVWGRRRIGKSFLLASLAKSTGGFYYEAIRGSRSEALTELGTALATQLGFQSDAFTSTFGFSLNNWEQAIEALMRLASDESKVVVLDEYPYLREHSPELDSIIQRAFGPRNPLRTSTQCRLVLCGSAMTVMKDLLSGTAPMRGRAGMDLRMSQFNFRDANKLHGLKDLRTAVRMYSIVGGVAAYASDMVDGDLPKSAADFDRWVCRRVLSPAAPLFREAELLLSEDPEISKARKINMYHAALAGVTSGRHSYSRLTDYLKISGPSLVPIMESLVSAEFIQRVVDPVRENRPVYYPADSILRFHYALIRPNFQQLASHSADTATIWKRLQSTFSSNVVGPTFETMARSWVLHHADVATVGGPSQYVGPTVVVDENGEMELDVVVASGNENVPASRTITAIGEAKSGERLSVAHVARLERARDALGERGREASLLLFGTAFTSGIEKLAKSRSDIELIDLDRLYGGS